VVANYPNSLARAVLNVYRVVIVSSNWVGSTQDNKVMYVEREVWNSNGYIFCTFQNTKDKI